MDIILVKILFVILWFQFLFVSAFLFQSNKGKTLSNYLLALIFLMISIAIVNLYINVFAVSVKFPQLLFVDDTFMFVYGPLLYLFTESVLFKKYQIDRKKIIHFIPFILVVIFLIFVMLNVKINSLIAIINSIENQDIPVYVRIGELLILSHIISYLILSKRKINRVNSVATDTYSNFNQDNLKRLNFILNGFIVLFVISLIHSILPFMGFRNGLLISLLFLIGFMFYFINLILLKMLQESTNNSGIITLVRLRNKEKYAGSKLTDAELNTYKSKLWNHMEQEKKYLNSELTIHDLAKELNLSSKILSQIINEGYSCNFFDFINKFRIEEAKRLILNQTDDKMTILEVMYDSGFNSKSSFNTAFKKITKLTPTEFKNSL